MNNNIHYRLCELFKKPVMVFATCCIQKTNVTTEPLKQCVRWHIATFPYPPGIWKHWCTFHELFTNKVHKLQFIFWKYKVAKVLWFKLHSKKFLQPSNTNYNMVFCILNMYFKYRHQEYWPSLPALTFHLLVFLLLVCFCPELHALLTPFTHFLNKYSIFPWFSLFSPVLSSFFPLLISLIYPDKRQPIVHYFTALRWTHCSVKYSHPETVTESSGFTDMVGKVKNEGEGG